MEYKSNNSCISKTHILSFMTPTFFAHFERDTPSISSKMSKNGGALKMNKVALGPLDQ